MCPTDRWQLSAFWLGFRFADLRPALENNNKFLVLTKRRVNIQSESAVAIPAWENKNTTDLRF